MKSYRVEYHLSSERLVDLLYCLVKWPFTDLCQTRQPFGSDLVIREMKHVKVGHGVGAAAWNCPFGENHQVLAEWCP